jgi:hypothetical protein
MKRSTSQEWIDEAVGKKIKHSLEESGSKTISIFGKNCNVSIQYPSII